jgi:hypothetical protein
MENDMQDDQHYPGTGSPWGEYADLDAWGAAAVPQYQILPGLDSVPNGDYDCRLGACELGHAGSERVLRAALHVGGRVVEYIWWLNRQEAVNRFLADMAALGFPARDWGSAPGKKPLSVAIPECARALEGVRFRASKTSRRDKRPGKENEVYHDLHISGRIDAAPMPSAPAAQARAEPAAAGVAAGVAGDDSDLPF